MSQQTNQKQNALRYKYVEYAVKPYMHKHLGITNTDHDELLLIYKAFKYSQIKKIDVELFKQKIQTIIDNKITDIDSVFYFLDLYENR